MYSDFFMTIVEVIFVEHQPSLLFRLTDLRFKAFARLWKHIGMIPILTFHLRLLSIRPLPSSSYSQPPGAGMSVEMPGPITQLLSECSGLVLDIGPGSGEILPRFDPSKITAIYGAEPAADLHPGLLANAQKHGFGQKYHALLCGGEPESLIPALHKAGVLSDEKSGGSAVFDEICCVRVLCGVPRPEETIKGLYGLLKPGGRMVVCEHVVNPWRTEGRVLARLLQVMYTLLGWPFFMGGCELQRHTEEFLKRAGSWKKFDLQYVEAKTTVPFVVGELIKADS
jgi:SAM-dependent methyltransferase